MSDDLDMETLDIGFEDIKPNAMRRILRTVLSKGMMRRKMQSKRDSVGDAEDMNDDMDDTLDEMEKNSSLRDEKRGAPAPLPAKETDFAPGDVRRALKTMPKGTLKKRK